MTNWQKMQMPIEEAIGLIKARGKEAPQKALDTAVELLSMNDGTCVSCGPTRLSTTGEYVHPYECQHTDRYDHNIAGLRKYFSKFKNPKSNF